MTVYIVSKQGDDRNSGQLKSPFLTINRAAQVAQAGDKVVIHQGTYREWINPQHAGKSPQQMITYQAAKDERVIIKGSEEVTNWESVGNGIWKHVVSNSAFGSFNPFDFKLNGDWLEQPNGRHAGAVYLDGRALFEAASYDEMANGYPRNDGYEYVTQKKVHNVDPQWTTYRWFAEVNADETIIFANFHQVNPNQRLTEINVRKYCFYPDQTGINYICVEGFEMAQAATNWAPPTAEQEGMIGVNWSKGWVIRNNDLHDSKCSAISLGSVPMAKQDQNQFARLHDRPGYQYQIETMFHAIQSGWDKQHVGSHVIDHNQIHDCGQAGIIGYLGGIFSRIAHNHIYRIGTRYEFGGWEIAALKLHAPIDTVIEHNLIENCSLGIGLDWQAQGTRITKNVLADNLRDLLFEVNHGPFLVDDNLLLSDEAINEFSQGGAFVNNLIAGTSAIQSVLNRTTPYHVPHSTQIKGYACVYGGDDRYFNNLFIRQVKGASVGTHIYNGSLTSMKQFVSQVEQRLPGDVELFETVRQPAYINYNAYFGGATAFNMEETNLIEEKWQTKLALKRVKNQVILTIDLPVDLIQFETPIQETSSLGEVRLAGAKFDNPDGTPIRLNHDFFNKKIDGDTRLAGPFTELKSGHNEQVVFEF